MVPNKHWTFGLLLGLVCACSGDRPVTLHAPDEYPERLSAWGVISADASGLRVPDHNYVYSLNTALFTDYALKLRTVYLPDGTSGRYHARDSFELPVGSVISKTFLYRTDDEGDILLDAHWDENPASLANQSIRLIETRLLVRQPHGWDALPYVWRGDDAYLSITGDLFTLNTTVSEAFNYIVPSRNQCATCHATNHTTGEVKPIGIKARHMNREDPVHGRNQITHLRAGGWLRNVPDPESIPANARWGVVDVDLDNKARSYLDINCGHCHNEAGAADTSGLLLDYEDHAPGALGVCKPPIAAGRGSGGFNYSIVPGDAANSIMPFRMRTTSPATMMPELGRSLAHAEGVALINDWVNAMQGECL